MTPTAIPSTLHAAGYALPVPPRTGIWRVDPASSSIELRVRDLHHTNVLSASILHGEVSLTDRAGSSTIGLRLGAGSMRRGTRRAVRWAQSVGLDTFEEPWSFDSHLLLASPDGWRMCGRIRASRLDTMLVANAKIQSVRTRADGHDAMALMVTGAISRIPTRGLCDRALGRQIPVRIQALLIHD